MTKCTITLSTQGWASLTNKPEVAGVFNIPSEMVAANAKDARDNNASDYDANESEGEELGEEEAGHHTDDPRRR